MGQRARVCLGSFRESAYKELRICEQRSRQLLSSWWNLLVWEKRCGRVDANQIYLARVTPIEDPDYSCAPFVTEDKSEVARSRTADLDGLAAGEPTVSFQEPQNLRPRIVKPALQELQNQARTGVETDAK